MYTTGRSGKVHRRNVRGFYRIVYNIIGLQTIRMRTILYSLYSNLVVRRYQNFRGLAEIINACAIGTDVVRIEKYELSLKQHEHFILKCLNLIFSLHNEKNVLATTSNLLQTLVGGM